MQIHHKADPSRLGLKEHKKESGESEVEADEEKERNEKTERIERKIMSIRRRSEAMADQRVREVRDPNPQGETSVNTVILAINAMVFTYLAVNTIR